MDINLYILVGIAALAYGLWVFNRLVLRRNACHNARAGIDVNLQKRHDLIPNLVACVKGYAAHEQATLTAVTTARTVAINSLGQANSAAAEDALASALATLNVRVEAYPELKAADAYLQLMRNLTEAEEQISASRRAFNAQVMRMNNLVQQFPTNLVARLTGFVTLVFYAAEATAHLAPGVDLSTQQP